MRGAILAPDHRRRDRVGTALPKSPALRGGSSTGFLGPTEGARIAVLVATLVGLAVIYLPPFYMLAISFNQGLQPALPGLHDLSVNGIWSWQGMGGC